ncbi:TPA: hypothetical protein ACHCCE_002475, partial [Vibrio parahaemolyticus]
AKPLTENVNFVTGINLHLIYSVGFVISIALLVVGMRNWRDNVQKPIDQMTKLNLKFRELELRKIENEMAIVILENDKVEQELINLVLEKKKIEQESINLDLVNKKMEEDLVLEKEKNNKKLTFKLEL